MTASQLGCSGHTGRFALWAPQAGRVELIERVHPEAEEQRLTPMELVRGDDEQSLWRAQVQAPLGYYRYRLELDGHTVEVADPWSRAITRQKKIGGQVWSVVSDPLPAAAGGKTLSPDSVSILEIHVGDQTSHPSADGQVAGSFEALTNNGAGAGLEHALRLQVDALELLPVASWPFYEQQGVNHWGYMPGYLLAVTHRYSRRWHMTPSGGWLGIDEQGVFHDPAIELRALIERCHAAGVGVIVDVVWNHISAEPSNPLRQLDPGDWLARDEHGQLANHSGCGNDLNSNNPYIRSLLCAAIERLFVEIGVDGVRLDLAEILDDTTLSLLRTRALAVRPDALLIAEPWSLGGYRPDQLAKLGWVVWSDVYREALRDALLSPDRPASRQLCASLSGGAQLPLSPALRHRFALNYIESHDGHPLADACRMALRVDAPHTDQGKAAVTLKLTQLAWALLAVTRGPIMVHQGQAFARSKWDRSHGYIRDTYNRDDEINWIDWSFDPQTQRVIAQAGSWMQARRRWLEPVFRSAQIPHAVLGEQVAALLYSASSASWPEDQQVCPSMVAVLWNLGRDSSSLTLPGRGWRVVFAPDAIQVFAAGPQSQLSLASESVAILVRDP